MNDEFRADAQRSDTRVTGPAARRAIPSLRDRRLAGRYPRYGTGGSPGDTRVMGPATRRAIPALWDRRLAGGEGGRKMENENNIYYNIPVLPLRGLVIYPGSILHFDVARDNSVLALNDSMRNGQHIFITSQKDPTKNDPEPDDLFEVGVYSQVMQVARLTEAYLRVVIRGVSRAKAIGYSEGSDYLKADVEELSDIPSDNYLKIEALKNMVKDSVQDYAMNNVRLPQDIPLRAADIDDPGRLADFVGDNLIRDYKDKQKLLELLDEESRMTKAYELLIHEISVLEI